MMQHMLSLENCAGLAAPQLGYGLRIIVFNVCEAAMEYRQDADAVVPPTVLINPSFKPLSNDKTVDWEGCFSINKQMGEVRRFTEISYEGFSLDGKKVSSIARGFLARLIQHEIDHINGISCMDHFEPALRHGSIEEMRKLVRAEREALKPS